jgi:cytochrome c-type biogenesis protein CcmH
MKNNRVISGEPLKLVERALKIDSRNIKALSMAGSEAFVRQDYTKATYYWKQVAEFGPKDSPIVLQVLPNLEQAQKLASMATSAKP